MTNNAFHLVSYWLFIRFHLEIGKSHQPHMIVIFSMTRSAPNPCFKVALSFNIKYLNNKAICGQKYYWTVVTSHDLVWPWGDLSRSFQGQRGFQHTMPWGSESDALIPQRFMQLIHRIGLHCNMKQLIRYRNFMALCHMGSNEWPLHRFLLVCNCYSWWFCGCRPSQLSA